MCKSPALPTGVGIWLREERAHGESGLAWRIVYRKAFTEVNRIPGDVLAKRVTRGPFVRLGLKPFAINGIGFQLRNNLPASDA